MKEKLYRPIINSDEHLVRSKDNPTRVRGVSLDKDNKNIDIPELEEVDIDRAKDGLIVAAATFVATKAIDLASDKIKNSIWWQNKVIPWKVDKENNIKGFINEKLGTKFKMSEVPIQTNEKTISYAKDELCNEMLMVSQDEFEEHVIRYIGLMYDLNNEEYFLKNAEITDTGKAKNKIVNETFKSLNDILKKKDIRLSDYSIKEIENEISGEISYDNGELKLVKVLENSSMDNDK